MIGTFLLSNTNIPLILSMSFLFPDLLWGLLALAIPIVIHLFNFRKTQRIIFSNTRFIHQIKQATTTKNKIKHWLVLATRLLFIIALVVAFAGPVLKNDEKGAADIVSIYIDNSRSMESRTDGDLQAVDVAVQHALQIIDDYPVGAQFEIITNDFLPEANFLLNKRDAREAIEAVALSGNSRNLSAVYNRQRLILEQNNVDFTDVFWIGDYQMNQYDLTNVALDTSFNHNIVQIPVQERSNVFVDTVYVQRSGAANLESNKLLVALGVSGGSGAEVFVEIISGDRQLSALSTEIVPQQNNEVTFDIPASDFTDDLIIRVDDGALTFDNEFYISNQASGKIKVFHIQGASPVQEIPQVFGNQQLFDYEGIAASQYDGSGLDQADLIIWDGLEALPAQLVSGIEALRQANVTMLFIPSATTNPASVRLLTNIENLTDEIPEQILRKPDFNQPFFEGVFDEQDIVFTMPSVTLKYTLAQAKQTLLQTGAGRPFLVEEQDNFYVFTAPLQRGFTDFQRHALFLPVMYQMAFGNVSKRQQLYFRLQDGAVDWYPSGGKVNADLTLALQMGDALIVPEQEQQGMRRRLFLRELGLEAGTYPIVHDDATYGSIALNYDKDESLLQYHALDDIEEYYADKAHMTIFSEEDSELLARSIQSAQKGMSLWKYFIILALLAILMEVLFIRFL